MAVGTFRALPLYEQSFFYVCVVLLMLANREYFKILVGNR